MCNILMIAAMKYSKTDGISKKICMQASALSSNDKKCKLLCLGEAGILQNDFHNSIDFGIKLLTEYSTNNKLLSEAGQIRDLLNSAQTIMKNDNFDLLYIRHMLPCFKLINLLHIAKKNGLKIAYEIPTFPYYKEQINISKNKLRTTIKLSLETFFWPLIYFCIDKLVVIRCNSKSLHLKKMLDINNGFSGSVNKKIIRDITSLNLIGVGTIYPYHGYERILESMKNTNCKINNKIDIKFHIVGESDEILRLKEYCTINNLTDNVKFYGKKTGSDLEEIYYKCNFGVGTLSLGLRGADIDTAIKNIEYLSYYIPVISSGKVFDIPEELGLIYYQAESSKIDFNLIYEHMKKFYSDDNCFEKIDNIIKRFEWENIMNNVVWCILK